MTEGRRARPMRDQAYLSDWIAITGEFESGGQLSLTRDLVACADGIPSGVQFGLSCCYVRCDQLTSKYDCGSGERSAAVC